jgi:hypothetical protein
VRNALYLRLKPKDKEMKKVFFLVGFSIPILLSMTFREASSYCGANPQIHFTIPEAPKALFPFDGHTGQNVIERLLKLK